MKTIALFGPLSGIPSKRALRPGKWHVEYCVLFPMHQLQQCNAIITIIGEDKPQFMMYTKPGSIVRQPYSTRSVLQKKGIGSLFQTNVRQKLGDHDYIFIDVKEVHTIH